MQLPWNLAAHHCCISACVWPCGKTIFFPSCVQLGGSASDQYYLHSDGSQDVSRVENALRQSFANGLVRNEQLDSDAGLPPSSAVEFVKQLPEVPSVMISDYDTEFDFNYYQSMVRYDCKPAQPRMALLFTFLAGSRQPQRFWPPDTNDNDLYTSILMNIPSCDGFSSTQTSLLETIASVMQPTS